MIYLIYDVIKTPIIFLFQSLVKQIPVVVAEAVPTGVLQKRSFDLYLL